MRLSFKPTPNLEIGLSRTAQWAGSGRPSDADSFFRLLIGEDNADGGASKADEPGNQLAGYDVRYSFAGFNLPLAIYGQFIGEDEAGGLPAKFLGLVGIEGWIGANALFDGDLRWRLEYVDTTANFQESDPLENTTYEHSTYRSGYRYYRRSLGHSLDNDSRMITLGFVYNSGAHVDYELVLRSGEFNRDGGVGPGRVPGGDNLVPGNTRSPVQADFYGADWTAIWRVTDTTKLDVGLSYLRTESDTEVDSDLMPYVEWSQAF